MTEPEVDDANQRVDKAGLERDEAKKEAIEARYAMGHALGRASVLERERNEAIEALRRLLQGSYDDHCGTRYVDGEDEAKAFLESVRQYSSTQSCTPLTDDPRMEAAAEALYEISWGQIGAWSTAAKPDAWRERARLALHAADEADPCPRLTLEEAYTLLDGIDRRLDTYQAESIDAETARAKLRTLLSLRTS